MENEINEFISKKILNLKNFVKKSLFVFILTIAAFLVILLTTEKPTELSQLINDEINNGTDISNQYATIEINKIEHTVIHLNNETRNYFFIYDENGKMYISNISTANSSYLLTSENVKYRLNGLTKKIPEELKQKCIKKYREIFNTNISDDEFDKTFGTVFIDTTLRPRFGFLALCSISIVIEIGICYAAFYQYLRIKNSFKSFNNSKDKDLFYEDLKAKNTVNFQHINTILTDRFLFDLNDCILIRCSDIKWVYQKTLDKEIKIAIYSYDKSGNESIIQTIIGWEEHKKEYEELIQKIIIKNEKNILVGYTKENKSKYKKDLLAHLFNKK